MTSPNAIKDLRSILSSLRQEYGAFSAYNHTLGKLLDSDWLRHCEFVRNFCKFCKFSSIDEASVVQSGVYRNFFSICNTFIFFMKIKFCNSGQITDLKGKICNSY